MAAAVHSPKRFTGQSVKRIESPRLLAGRGRFLDDIHVSGMLEAAILRSPHPHARIVGIDVSRALAMSGVFAVVTGADLAALSEPLPTTQVHTPDQRETPTYALATDRVRWVGQGVAAVAAVDRYVAEDALNEIAVEYEVLPAVPDLESALRPDAPVLYDGWPDNLAGSASWVIGDADKAFAEAEVVVAERFTIGRVAGLPLETRGVIAAWDPIDDELDVWLSTQAPTVERDYLAKTLRIPDHKIRVRVPDVGGGFGIKFDIHGEPVVAAVLSRRTGRPVKFVEDRMESFTASVHARELVVEAAMAGRRDGSITAVRGTVHGVLGGAIGTVGIGPSIMAASLLTGAYRIPNCSIDFKAVLTNRTPIGSFRGWGQPEGHFVVERLLDLLAKRLERDPNELRKINFPQPEEFPHLSTTGKRFDSGRFADTVDQCATEVERQEWRRLQTEARRDGRSIGIGYAFHVEVCSWGPSRELNANGTPHSGFDEEIVRMDPSGRITILTGQVGMGQGICTALAQIAADVLGVPLEHVTVVTGDTAACPFTGYGTAGSRAASLGGAALMGAAEKLREKVVRVAGKMLEADPDDLDVGDGRVFVRGASQRGIAYEDIAHAAYHRLELFPVDEEPTLVGRCVFDPDNVSFSYMHTAAMVEVDRQTGLTKVLKMIMAHDCGTVINPANVDGQLYGGATQGIGEVLFEELVYDDAGQLVTNSLVDYLIPTAYEVPRFTALHLETAAPHIPGGMKGMGEAGVISPPVAIANAIDDALADLDVKVTQMPMPPERLLPLIRRSERAGEGGA